MENHTRNKEISVTIHQKSIRNYFNKIANGNIVANRNFWKIIKLFLSNKGHLENVDIVLNHNDKIVMITNHSKPSMNMTLILFKNRVVKNPLT